MTEARVETPLIAAWRKKELVALLDTSGSMEWPAAEGSTVTRVNLVGEALPIFVAALEKEDSAAAEEQKDGSDEEGGLLVHGFADAHTELGDFNSSNFDRRWDAIRWGGRTYIMGAWKAAIQDFNKEFGGEVEPPALLTLIITDGEAKDAAQFIPVLTETNPNRFFAVAIVGYGPDHDATLASYKQAETANPKNVRIYSFDSLTDPRALANDLITMAGLTS
jgi:hypothetical protein